MAEMVMASFMKIWHLIPIAIGIVLLKMYVSKRDFKNTILKHEENEKKGLTLVVRAEKKYVDMGYHIEQMNEDIEGIDFICTRDDRMLIIQCNNSTEIKSITDADIRNFHKLAKDYVKEHNMENNNMELRYIITSNKVLHKSAVQILSNHAYGCKYLAA